MNHNELKLIRKLLNLSKEEAAKYLGEDMGGRMWENYERDYTSNFGVKPYIAQKLYSLLNWRKTFIRNVLKNYNNTSSVIVYYDTPDHFEDFLIYKAHLSATITLNVDYGFNLIKFNHEEFLQFAKKNNLENTEQNIVIWANEKYSEIKKIEERLIETRDTLEKQKALLLQYCKNIGFEKEDSFRLVNKLTTVSQKEISKQNDDLSELTKYLAKNLPHTLYQPEYTQIKTDLTLKVKNYVALLIEWGRLYHKTKALIKGV